MPRRALLIGINYTGTPAELQGCVNDVEAVKDMLVSYYAFKPVRDKLLFCIRCPAFAMQPGQFCCAPLQPSSSCLTCHTFFFAAQPFPFSPAPSTVLQMPWDLVLALAAYSSSHAVLHHITLLAALQGDITTMVDTDQGSRKPTGRNIKAAISQMVKEAREGDELFIHFSGHGTQVSAFRKDSWEEAERTMGVWNMWRD